MSDDQLDTRAICGDDRALLRELYEWALDACHQGTGEPFQSTPTWHAFTSTWEYADELLPRVKARLDGSADDR